MATAGRPRRHRPDFARRSADRRIRIPPGALAPPHSPRKAGKFVIIVGDTNQVRENVQDNSERGNAQSHGANVGLVGDKITIRGGRPLIGRIEVKGAKNLVTKAMVAALLGETPS